MKIIIVMISETVWTPVREHGAFIAYLFHAHLVWEFIQPITFKVWAAKAWPEVLCVVC